MRLKRALRVAVCCVLLNSSRIDSQCVTNSTVITCSDCPSGDSNCWQSRTVSYTVFGTKEETWCNYSNGWCTDAYSCDTVSSITTSVDCEGDNHYAQWSTIRCDHTL
jgi:hypothetical protein